MQAKQKISIRQTSGKRPRCARFQDLRPPVNDFQDSRPAKSQKRKRQPGEAIVMRTSFPHVHARNATQAPNPLAFESFVCNIVNQVRQAKLKIIASPRLSVFKGSAAPALVSARVSASRRSSARASKILGQQMTALTSSTCQQTDVIYQISSARTATSMILAQPSAHSLLSQRTTAFYSATHETHSASRILCASLQLPWPAD